MADYQVNIQRTAQPVPFQPLIGEEGQVPLPVPGQNAAANAALLERLRAATTAQVAAQTDQVSTPEQAAATIAAMRAKSMAGPAGAQLSTALPVSESMPGPERYTRYPGTDYTQSREGRKVFIFSPNSAGNTIEEFANVIQRYNTSGGTDIAKGWAIVEPGKMADLRTAYNSARDKLQKYIQESGSAIGSSIGKILAAPGTAIATGTEALGITPEGSAQDVSSLGARIGSATGGAVGKFVASPLDNPESLGATAGAILAMLRSKGLSVVPAAFKAATAAVTGYTAGGLATGSDIDLKSALAEGLIAAASTGAPAVFQSALNRLPSQRAKQQILEGISDELKKTYGSISNDPQAMKAMLDTPAGISTAVQKGIKGIIGDFEQTGGKLLDSILEVTKGNLAAGPQRTVTNRVKEMGRLATDFINATGDPAKLSEAVKAYNIAKAELINAVDQGLSGSGKNAAYYNRITRQVTDVVNEFESTLTAYRPALELFDILKKSGADRNIIIRELQQQLRGTSKTGSQLLENVGKIAGRGADLTQDIDKSYSIGVGRLLEKLGVPKVVANAIPYIPIGQKYVGKVTGTLPGTSATIGAAAQQTIRSMDSFLAEDNR